MLIQSSAAPNCPYLPTVRCKVLAAQDAITGRIAITAFRSLREVGYEVIGGGNDGGTMCHKGSHSIPKPFHTPEPGGAIYVRPGDAIALRCVSEGLYPRIVSHRSCWQV
jgi:hypothetical protein